MKGSVGAAAVAFTLAALVSGRADGWRAAWHETRAGHASTDAEAAVELARALEAAPLLRRVRLELVEIGARVDAAAADPWAGLPTGVARLPLAAGLFRERSPDVVWRGVAGVVASVPPPLLPDGLLDTAVWLGAVTGHCGEVASHWQERSRRLRRPPSSFLRCPA